MKVFISHASDDAHIVTKIRNYLVHRDIDVFDDKADISVGSNLISSINEAINSSDAVLFIISKNFDKSRWVHQEMSLAISNRLKGKAVKLIPIVVERNSEIPFFLKDYIFLDISESNDFDSAMRKLTEGLASNQETSIQQDLVAKQANIEIEKELLMLESLQHEEYRKFRTQQMLYFAIITTICSSVAVSIGLLVWAAKIDYTNFDLAIAFSIGSLATLIVSVLYLNREQLNKDELIRRIGDIHNLVKDLETRHDK